MFNIQLTSNDGVQQVRYDLLRWLMSVDELAMLKIMHAASALGSHVCLSKVLEMQKPKSKIKKGVENCGVHDQGSGTYRI
jgi:hypothetical protein